MDIVTPTSWSSRPDGASGEGAGGSCYQVSELTRYLGELSPGLSHVFHSWLPGRASASHQQTLAPHPGSGQARVPEATHLPCQGAPVGCREAPSPGRPNHLTQWPWESSRSRERLARCPQACGSRRAAHSPERGSLRKGLQASLSGLEASWWGRSKKPWPGCPLTLTHCSLSDVPGSRAAPQTFLQSPAPPPRPPLALICPSSLLQASSHPGHMRSICSRSASQPWAPRGWASAARVLEPPALSSS